MILLESIATEVFQILRSYDYTVVMYDDDGNQIYEPEDARRFFAKPNNLLVSIVDNGDNSSIRLYLGKSTDISDVVGLDQTLRATATKYNMIFNVRRYGRDLKPSDFATKASVTEGKEEAMNIFEGMYGTTRSSYLKLENARMIVRHSKKIDETMMGSRGRHINEIFVENAVGERFLFPTRQLAPARAMTQHVNHGGGFADQVGQQIQRMATDYANLGSASGYVAANANNLSESAVSLRETCRKRMHEMKKCFERLYRPGGYLGEAHRIEEQCNTLNENDSASDPVDTTEVRKTLAMEGIELDESILVSVAEAVKACECDDKEMSEGVLKKNDNDGTDTVGVFGRQLSASAWDDFANQGKLALIKEPHVEGDGPRFANLDAKLSYLLGLVIPEVQNDSMMNFLSHVADKLQEHNNEVMQKNLRRVAAQAIRLAGLSLNEGLAVNHEAVREFDEWMSGHTAEHVLAEREDDEHDYSDHEPSYRDDDDRDEAVERASESVMNDFDPEAFLAAKGEDFAWGDNGMQPEEKEFDKKFIMNLLASYLSDRVREETDIDDVNMDKEAMDLWDTVEPLLTGAGYSLSEGELSREDMVIQTNQDASLKREVTKPSSTDPYTGDEVPTDAAYIERMRTLAGFPNNR